MSISPKTPTSSSSFSLRGLVGSGHIPTAEHLKSMQKDHNSPTNHKTPEKKKQTIKEGIENILSNKTNGQSKTNKDRNTAEQKLRLEIAKLKPSEFKDLALSVLNDLNETSTNDSEPQHAIIPDSSYGYNRTQLQALKIDDTRNIPGIPIESIKTDHSETQDVSRERSDSDLTQAPLRESSQTSVLEHIEIDTVHTSGEDTVSSQKAVLSDLIADLKTGNTQEDLNDNMTRLEDFIETWEDIPDSPAAVVKAFVSFVDTQVTAHPSDAKKFTAAKTAFSAAFIEKYGLLVPNESPFAANLATAPRGSSIMRDPIMSFNAKLDYLADAGAGLALLHEFGHAHGNFSIDHTVLHNGHGLLVDVSLDRPDIASHQSTSTYPAPESLGSRTAITPSDLQKQDVFAFGIEILHAVADKTIPNLPLAGFRPSEYKFPTTSAVDKKTMASFMKTTQRLVTDLSKPREKYPIRPGLASLIHDCLQGNPQDRISMEDAVTRLRELTTNHPETPNELFPKTA
jgi:hypothetical protein